MVVRLVVIMYCRWCVLVKVCLLILVFWLKKISRQERIYLCYPDQLHSHQRIVVSLNSSNKVCTTIAFILLNSKTYWSNCYEYLNHMSPTILKLVLSSGYSSHYQGPTVCVHMTYMKEKKAYKGFQNIGNQLKILLTKFYSLCWNFGLVCLDMNCIQLCCSLSLT